MNCPFCKQEMFFDGYAIGAGCARKRYLCGSIKCLVDEDWSRYKCIVNEDDSIYHEEYALGKFYVKVYDKHSSIYRFEACMLFDEVQIPRQLFLNHINTGLTLDKVKTLVIFS